MSDFEVGMQGVSMRHSCKEVSKVYVLFSATAGGQVDEGWRRTFRGLYLFFCTKINENYQLGRKFLFYIRQT
jgi:hypothetical protein